MTNNERLQQIFRDVFEEDELVLREDMTMKDIDAWDSVAHFQMIMETELEFDIKFSTAEIAGFKNVGELLALIKKHQGEK